MFLLRVNDFFACCVHSLIKLKLELVMLKPCVPGKYNTITGLVLSPCFVTA